MDVVISSGWRSGTTNVALEPLDEMMSRIPTRTQDNTPSGDAFISKHGRYEVTLRRDGDAWLIRYTSSGRLFGPKVEIYSERHVIARHAAWDVMCRVIRATGDEAAGIDAGRQAAHWLQEHQADC